MKKNDFDNRLQNDLFPEMPVSFGHKLTETMENEGVRVKKRPTAAGVFAAAVSVVAAAACSLNCGISAIFSTIWIGSSPETASYHSVMIGMQNSDAMPSANEAIVRQRERNSDFSEVHFGFIVSTLLFAF